MLVLIHRFGCRYDYLPYFYSRVFEYEGSSRKVWWQFYGDNGEYHDIHFLHHKLILVIKLKHAYS